MAVLASTTLLRPMLPPAVLLLRGGWAPPASLASLAAARSAIADIDAVALQELVVSITLYVGTLMSSLSGCISAGSKQMDVLGCVVVAMMTSVGGGTLRDMMLQRRPFWLDYPAHLHVCAWTSVFTFVLWPWLVGTGFKDTHLAFLWSDAIGMAASTVIGAHIGLEQTGMPIVGVICGVVTATFGGIGRDVLCLEPPRALYAERSMYATPALLGAACYVGFYMLNQMGVIYTPQWIGASVPFFLALFVRAAAWTYRLALPRWARKSQFPAFGLFNFGDTDGKPQFKLELKHAPGGKDGG